VVTSSSKQNPPRSASSSAIPPLGGVRFSSTRFPSINCKVPTDDRRFPTTTVSDDCETRLMPPGWDGSVSVVPRATSPNSSVSREVKVRCSLCHRSRFFRRAQKAYCYMPFTPVKRYFYWALKSPLRKSGFRHIRNTSGVRD
jgi:hypothetical protein